MFKALRGLSAHPSLRHVGRKIRRNETDTQGPLQNGEISVRVLVLFAHPVETSFGASLHAKVVETLQARGHEVDDCDLNAEGFDPVMTRQDRLDYYDVPGNRGRVAPYVDRLLKSDALIFSFPVWNMGFPAILKGFVDKVFLPGVSFNLKDDGSYVPCLHNIKRLGAVCTYGGARWTTFLMGDPPRRFLKRSMRLNCAPGARCDYFAGYDMDHTTPERRVRFLKAVERKFATW
jgi:NAD(P)H dehydrogenase (quinone)